MATEYTRSVCRTLVAVVHGVVPTASFVPSGDSAIPRTSAPTWVAGIGSLVIVSDAPEPVPTTRTRYQVRDRAIEPVTPYGSRWASATNVRSSAAPVIPAKLRPRGGWSVASVFPVSVERSSSPTGMVSSPAGWLNVR